MGRTTCQSADLAALKRKSCSQRMATFFLASLEGRRTDAAGTLKGRRPPPPRFKALLGAGLVVYVARLFSQVLCTCICFKVSLAYFVRLSFILPSSEYLLSLLSPGGALVWWLVWETWG